MIWSCETHPQVSILRERLDIFYGAEDNDYQAFESISRQDDYWNIVKNSIDAFFERNMQIHEPCRVLEFGAGRTGFADSLGQLRAKVNYSVQDVTSRNFDYLNSVADQVYIGDLSLIDKSFDIIFSTFVYEHVTNPKATLDALLQMLNPNGSLFLFCPRYDWPGYVPPALRHLGRWRGLWLSIKLQLSRLTHRLTTKKTGVFYIVTEPAVFHVPKWFRDSDAIHLVSRGDLIAYAREHDLTVRDCWPNKGSFRANFLEGLLKLCVEIKRM